jgi:two-component system sensor histidine kinase KdpD
MKTSHPLFWELSFSLIVISISTAVNFALLPFFELTNLIMVYLLGTMVVAMRGSKPTAAFSAVMGVLCFNFFFVPPRFTFRVSDTHYIFTFVVMFLAAMIISHLTIRLRSEAEAARQGQNRTALMHAFTQELATARSLGEFLPIALKRISEIFNSHVTAFIFDSDRKILIEKYLSGTASTEKEYGVAHWVYERGEPVGLGTSSLSSEDSYYMPLVGASGPVGVLKLKPRSPSSLFASDQKLLLDSFAQQLALSLEVDRLQNYAKKTELEAETERLRSSLLSSVSHDFRTPLTSIVGSASALLSKEEIKNNPKIKELLETIQEEGERLSRQVQNLLETTRLESGQVILHKEKYPIEDIIGSALERLKKLLQDRKVEVKIPEDFPPIPLDGLLLEQVFINLFENAARHTPAGNPIEISISKNSQDALITIADHGPGLSEGDFDRVFDKFYHGKLSPGAGLGLAICRAVVNAHGGRIWAENRMGGGALFSFTLPLE